MLRFLVSQKKFRRSKNAFNRNRITHWDYGWMLECKRKTSMVVCVCVCVCVMCVVLFCFCKMKNTNKKIQKKKVDYSKLYDVKNFIAVVDISIGTVFGCVLFGICSVILSFFFLFFMFLLITDTYAMKISYFQYIQQIINDPKKTQEYQSY